MINYNASEKSVSCSLCKFEFSGILCRHVFRVLIVVSVLALPEGYILRQWTRNAKSNILSYDHCGVLQTNCRKALTWRCSDLCHDAIIFVEEGTTSMVIYKISKGALPKSFSEVFAAKKGTSSNGTRTPTADTSSVSMTRIDGAVMIQVLEVTASVILAFFYIKLWPTGYSLLLYSLNNLLQVGETICSMPIGKETVSKVDLIIF